MVFGFHLVGIGTAYSFVENPLPIFLNEPLVQTGLWHHVSSDFGYAFITRYQFVENNHRAGDAFAISLLGFRIVLAGADHVFLDLVAEVHGSILCVIKDDAAHAFGISFKDASSENRHHFFVEMQYFNYFLIRKKIIAIPTQQSVVGEVFLFDGYQLVIDGSVPAVVVANQRFGVVDGGAFVVEWEDYGFVAAWIVNLDESEIVVREVAFYHVPCKYFEGLVRGGEYGDVAQRVPTVIERAGHLEDLLQGGHELFVERKACGFVPFGHHLVAQYDEGILPTAELGLLLRIGG